jgi:nitroreductase
VPIRPVPPAAIPVGEPVPRAPESAETLLVLARRKSAPVAMLGEPGPSPADLDALLALAMRAPDHRKLEPWRFLVFEGTARVALGGVFAQALAEGAPETTAARLAEARALAMRAPVVVAVISSPVEDTKGTPRWEQELSAGAVCQTLLVAAAASGWDACWITEWPAFDTGVAKRLGLGGAERFAGFIYLGTSRERPVERVRPDPATRVRRWPGR